MGLKDMFGLSIIALAAIAPAQGRAQAGPDAGQCEQVRAAIAEHGLKAARKHAMENYGLTPADVRRVEQECGIDSRGRMSRKQSGD